MGGGARGGTWGVRVGHEGACEDALCEHAARLALVCLHAHGLERLAQLARVDVAAVVEVEHREGLAHVGGHRGGGGDLQPSRRRGKPVGATREERVAQRGPRLLAARVELERVRPVEGDGGRGQPGARADLGGEVGELRARQHVAILLLVREHLDGVHGQLERLGLLVPPSLRGRGALLPAVGSGALQAGAADLRLLLGREALRRRARVPLPRVRRAVARRVAAGVGEAGAHRGRVAERELAEELEELLGRPRACRGRRRRRVATLGQAPARAPPRPRLGTRAARGSSLGRRGPPCASGQASGAVGGRTGAAAREGGSEGGRLPC